MELAKYLINSMERKTEVKEKNSIRKKEKATVKQMKNIKQEKTFEYNRPICQNVVNDIMENVENKTRTIYQSHVLSATKTVILQKTVEGKQLHASNVEKKDILKVKMESTDVELEQQLKDAGKQLSHPPNSLQLLHVLNELEKLLLKVDQALEKSILDALKSSRNALIHSSLSKYLDIDVRVSVASCICEITRITARDAPPYTDDQMRLIVSSFQLIVSSFEDLADQSSQSYNKRASILKTVSKVRLFNIMLDLECDELIMKMFEHFLKSVRDYHLDAMFSSMENIMVSVIEESEEVSVELLKPLLASVKKDCKGVLPVAHKLGKGVLLKSANKLKPCIIPTLTSLGESLDMYHKVVAAICEGTTTDLDNIDDNDSGLQLANECKLKKGSLKSVKSNEVTDDSDADKLLKENSQTEKVFINTENGADTIKNLVKKGTSKKKDDGKKRKRSTGRDKVKFIMFI
ncbi:sister chromatid cohesion protein PDS5 homolog C-like [Bidens hawaiensis]|uniref:sister chromatid cohesion protein PDS5 homolog C-like n=1 Tax=Bidens hawaiensis TaxID=980011 RepID=UPI0040492AE8